MMKKAVMVLVLFLFLSLTFALAEETANNNDITTDSSCNFGCKIWEFLFGNKEARAGKAWFDRSEPLVGQADTLTYGGWSCKYGSLCYCLEPLGCGDNNGGTHFPPKDPK